MSAKNNYFFPPQSRAEQSRVLLEKLIVAKLTRNSLPFMEPEGSSPCSQQPTKSDDMCNIS